ncbi:hypothetical protein [Rubellimicrobium roseum]|uniref:Uncharacterized protein n=1 Tax=Rubellimicrobium roseum TaxID=687525 RepID=A0A5C4NAA0_9RHOB|nr:hypothetical protein [Rubellimicrobium roseum]TNC71771.1 hypothetical protein FHG71_10105 [Rubellimicrobium roseum]
MRKAVLDLFATDPPPLDQPRLAFPNVIVSPGIAGLTAGTRERLVVRPVQNALDFLAGRFASALIVNRDLL